MSDRSSERTTPVACAPGSPSAPGSPACQACQHATACISGPSAGSRSRHSAVASGQRGWKRQPAGTSRGLGTSPVKMIRCRARSGSGTGTADSSAWVYGCRGWANSDCRRSDFHDLAQVHHRRPVSDVPHHGEVVGHEQVGHAEALLQIVKQVQHLGLHAHIEGRHRLVGDDQPRPGGQGAGDDHPLPLPAAELVRVAASTVRTQADQLQQGRPPASGRSRSGIEAVDQERLGDGLADRHARVEGGEGVLEDDLRLLPQRPQLAAAQAAAHRARRRRRCPRSARSAAGRNDPACSCRNRFRRPGPASRRRSARSSRRPRHGPGRSA